MRQISLALLIIISQQWTAHAARCRDPFLAFPDNSAEQPLKVPNHRPPGLQGIRIAETILVGVVCSEELFLAILKGEDQAVYIVRVGSRLLDGRVLQISDHGILFSQSDRSTPVFKLFRREALQ